MQISVCISGTRGLTWPVWQKLVTTVEDLGFVGLYLSDHHPGGHPALETMTALAYAAARTHRIHLGPLVAALSFRDPRLLAWQAATLDHLSCGRLILGVGTGWHVEEHQRWGYPLGDGGTRKARFQEGLEVITRLLQNEDPVSYAGQTVQLKDAFLLPRPYRSAGPPILVGGNGTVGMLPLVAQYAGIWNANNLSVAAFRERNTVLNDLLCRAGRAPDAVKRTLYLAVLCGRDAHEMDQRLAWFTDMAPHTAHLQLPAKIDEMAKVYGPFLAQFGATFSSIVGTPEYAVAQMRLYEEAGVEEFILQWIDPLDVAGLQLVAEAILPSFAPAPHPC